MNHLGRLYYEIAGLPLVLETPNAHRVSQFLTPYAPFRIQSSDIIKARVHFIAGVSITIPSNLIPIDKGEFEGGWSKIYSDQYYYYTEMELFGRSYRMRATKDWTQVESDVDLIEKDAIFALNSFLIPAYGMQLIKMQGLKIHASVIMIDGRALLFMGTSGTGKSTHTRLWRKYIPSARLLNDDEPIIRLFPNGEVRVYGAPWSGKTPCYINESAKVVAMVLLKQAPENKIIKGKYGDALSALVMSTSVLRTDIDHRNSSFELLADIAEKVPFYTLECLPDKGAVELTYPLLSNQN
ncbi:hypothetical protein [uncultured Porphyromonas sp.]|uniref:hypothetical protein n=1 Tax=uncultured Porphyromonas sp. TaxID=159274 RepID=UPI00261A7B92|nr:hypothetical protein [uncultured Porphyromonas sp.]